METELNFISNDAITPMVVEVVDGLGQVIARTVVDAEIIYTRSDGTHGYSLPGLTLADDFGVSDERRAELIRQGGSLRIWPTVGHLDVGLTGPHFDPH